MTIVNYAIVPRNRRYWIESIAEDGLRQAIEHFDAEDAAVRRLRELRVQNGIVGRWDFPAPPRQR
jgi:hypothetical protein